MIEDEPIVIDFGYLDYIGRVKLKLKEGETGRLTLKQFNKMYSYYKNDFDLEMFMTATHTTYAKLKAKEHQSESWF